jgi:hypothetical protein
MIRLAALLLLAGAAQAQTVVIYSRADADQAHRAQQLAAVYGSALIDRHLQPGQPWRATIAGQLCSADRVLLVWSASAAASGEVRREIDTALQCRRPIVPVLIDSTPLPGLVADVQAVDWR